VQHQEDQLGYDPAPAFEVMLLLVVSVTDVINGALV